LSLLLAQVHRDGALTRAELTQRLGLSRSTIGALVADLSDLQLLSESVPTGGTRAGRPSHVVGPHALGPYVVAVDVDVTHVTIATIGIGGTVLTRRDIPASGTAPTPQLVARQVADVLHSPAADISRPGPVAIGVSVPGTVDRRDGTVGIAPNLGWRDVAFGRMIAEVAPPVPVMIGNDADLAVFAEHIRGNARDCDDVIYLMGRVGVGAGIIANGRALRGRDGHAGEIGHSVMDASGPRCHCGKNGCLEVFIGEAALLALAGEDGPPTDGRVRAIFDRARVGDRRTLDAVRHFAGSLGKGLALLVNTLNPQRFILGGSFADVLELAPAEVESALAHFSFDLRGEKVELREPAFGSDSALLGAAEIAFADLLADPVTARALVVT
jgi:predicted NBD/HSP70 family sugar kinase